MRAHVTNSNGGIDPGATVSLRVPLLGPLGFNWDLVHDRLDNSDGFVDIQQHGPFQSWRHEHRFEAAADGYSVIEDRLTYTLPFTAVTDPLAGERIRSRLEDLFRFRHRRTQVDVARHAASGLDAPLRIVVSGASGLVGSRLVPFLRAGGHQVFKLVRHQPRVSDEIFWDPATGKIDEAALESMDAVIHLAGVSIAGGRWTRSRKAAIIDSRLDGTRLLATTLAGLHHPPRVFVSTSAVGFYGDGGQADLTEESPTGEGFLASVCRAWEHAALPAADAGIRIVNPRFGVVFAGEGGMLPLLGHVFRTGTGGQLGNGRQYMAWIALDDLIGVLFEAITNDQLEGPINAVAPETVTNQEFTRAMGRVLNRPTLMRVPAVAMRLVAGELADDLILVSQRVIPARLEASGFQFASPSLEDTLRHEFGRYATCDENTGQLPFRVAARYPAAA
jgi:uncharacterized protein (TIGR01777 family)